MGRDRTCYALSLHQAFGPDVLEFGSPPSVLRQIPPGCPPAADRMTPNPTSTYRDRVHDRERTSLETVAHYSWREVYEALSCPTTIEPEAGPS